MWGESNKIRYPFRTHWHDLPSSSNRLAGFKPNPKWDEFVMDLGFKLNVIIIPTQSSSPAPLEKKRSTFSPETDLLPKCVQVNIKNDEISKTSLHFVAKKT